MELVQDESMLLHLAVSAVFSGLTIYKLTKNKVKIENASVCGLLSLLTLGIISFFCASGRAVLTLFVLSCVAYYFSIPVRDMLPMEGKAVLITGCDSGLGHALAKHLDELGVLVFAGVLDKKGPGAEELKKICSSRLSLIQLDVTSGQEIKTACDKIKSRVRDEGLWGIVHNAGVLGYMADGELLPISVYKQCLNVNFIGAAHVTKMFMPLLRKAKGRLVSISSMAGHTPIPGFAAYAASKAALTMFCAVMRQDLFKWGVKVATIHPSGFKTNIFGSRENWSAQDQNILANLTADVKDDYGEEYLLKLRELHDEMAAISSSDLTPVLEDACHALFAQSPNSSYTPGRFAYLIPCLFRYFPLWVYDYFAKQIFQIHRNILPRSLRLSRTKNNGA
ncbi:17-beta-hydroxysteroid dehydrogenase type 2 [Spea bombifrons]|uniref:17-beta-hydroxysteroid dehydrogenase type 2 n=1 Tax=Spea bombifrons TaxID=233779 RepID=UPI00234AE178|nr:17-beta-hydroxysteroid dehydrogenase type 2 [Spea bombifrons]